MTAPTNNPRGRRVPTIGTVIPDRDQRDWVTLPELVAESGLTYRQADYWIRTNLIVPLDEPTPGSGIIRRLSVDQVERARILADLINAGVSLTTCRLIIDDLQASGEAQLGPVQLIHHITSTGAATA